MLGGGGGSVANVMLYIYVGVYLWGCIDIALYLYKVTL